MPDPAVSEDSAEARFAELRGSLGAAVGRLASGYERDRERARDLEQEILVALWRSLPGFRGESSLRTWAFRIAHNVAITYVHRARRTAAQQWVELDELDGVRATELERTLMSRDLLERIQTLLERLTSVDREVMLLYLEGLPQREIAEVCGISMANVSTKIHRIRRTLSVGMKDEEDSRASS